ncbi:MAG: hypothetical protein RL685_3703 [Pseudomonadota bacterium]|jgi:serine/threonine protein kinase
MTRETLAVAERAPQVGDTIGYYRLLGVAGDGSLGRIYVAEQRKIRDVSNTVAVRCIRPDLAQQPGFHSCFMAAAALASRLEHPNVLSIHEMSDVDGMYFFSMEYLPGENVASILTKCNTGSPVPPDIAVAIVKQAANAAQYVRDLASSAGAHALGQGELEPANLFVTYHGTVKWLAVGLHSARGHGPAASGEHPMSWVTPASDFWAPEQSDGVADARTDVFSLGALLWTFLTGHRPHLALAPGETDAGLGHGVPPSNVQPEVPEALDAIVMRALSPEPERRFQTTRELSEALDRYLLQRDCRPTHKHIRRWMEQLFDAERAALQLQIARGRDVVGGLASLASWQGGGSAPATSRSSRRARELWSTRHSIFARPERVSLEPGRRSLPHEALPVSQRDLREGPATFRAVPPPSAQARPNTLAPQSNPGSRLWPLGALLAVCAAVAAGAGALLSSDSSSTLQGAPRAAPVAERRAQLEVRSTPEGAAVFVDGEPTGLRTPAVLKSLVAGRLLRVRVEKAGFASQERKVTLSAGAATAEAFDLLSSNGLVHFAGVPSGAHLFVDEARVALDGKAVSLSVGRHAVRIEAQSSLIFSGTVVVAAGEQTIRIDGAAVAP